MGERARGRGGEGGAKAIHSITQAKCLPETNNKDTQDQQEGWDCTD